MESFEKKDRENTRDEIFSKAIRAGKRTYFFDVKATRRNEYYLTITESKKRFDRDGRFHFEKHKLFLYKEDFEKFADGLTDVIDYIKENAPKVDELPMDEQQESTENASTDFTNVEFEDLKSEE